MKYQFTAFARSSFIKMTQEDLHNTCVNAYPRAPYGPDYMF